MSQCVPSWDLDDPPNPPANFSTGLQHSSAVVPLVPLTDGYEVAELTWENGQLALHGHGGAPRFGAKPPTQKYANSSWSKPHPTGTLESVVHQATGAELFPAGAITTPHDIADWLGAGAIAENGYALGVAAAVDALVPCRDAEVPAASGSVASAAKKKAAKVGVCSSQGSVAAPQKPLAVSRWLRDESILASIDSRGVTDEVEITNTTATAVTASDSDVPEDGSGGSPETEDTMFRSKRMMNENDSVTHDRRSLHTKRDEVCEEEEKGKGTKREAQRPSNSNKKSRAAIIHNQSERKRRDRINQKMKMLQKLVPNASKTDKASILDEVIEYLKQLQAQVQVMSRMSSMMLPMPMPQLQMAMMANMAQMAQMAQMGMGMIDMTAINRLAQPAIPPLLHPSAFMPLTAATWDGFGDRMPQASSTIRPDPFSAFLAYQNAQQPMNLDGYNRMATLFQQLYPQRPPTNPHS